MAAEYYFSRHDYKEALKLWNKVLDKNPKNVDALMRVSELSLMFGSRELSRKVITDFLDKWSQKITPDPNTVLGRKALQLQSMGIELLVNTFHLDAKRAMGVLLPNEGVLMLKAKVLDANHGGFVLNHEMDHAILSQMEKNLNKY